MKKLLLFGFSLLFVSLLSARTVATMEQMNTELNYLSGADTLELYDTLGVLINNGTIKISGSDPNVDFIQGHIWVKNTTTTEMPNVYVRRIINQEVGSSQNSICFGIMCYPPSTNQSANPTVLAPEVLDKSFYAEYYPNGNGGLTSITYEFFDEITFGTKVSAKATIEFAISANSINEDKLVFKGPFPNPSSQYATFEYNLPAIYNNAELIIRNLLGIEVGSFTFENGTGKKAIDVSRYASGIYFYSYIVDDKVIQSKKLIVKH
jgi:hypothetical protein